MMLQADNIDLLGITLVTGDAWMKQEMAFTLRLLEIMGRTEIPVYPGAEFPMLNTKEEWLLRLQLYGGHRLDPWLGAFNRTQRRAGRNPAAAAALRSLREHQGSAGPRRALHHQDRPRKSRPGDHLCGRPADESGAGDCSCSRHRALGAGSGFHGHRLPHVHQFLQCVFRSRGCAKGAARSGGRNSASSLWTWPKRFTQGDEIAPGRRMIEEIAVRAQSPISDLFQRYAVEPLRRDPNMRFFRMADEMLAAQVIDPGVFTKIRDRCTWTFAPRRVRATGIRCSGRKIGRTFPMLEERPVTAADRRVFVDPSQFYMGPPPSAGLVNVLQEVDHDRFKKLFVDLMTQPIRKA